VYGAGRCNPRRPLATWPPKIDEGDVKFFRTLIVFLFVCAAGADSAFAQTLTRGPLIQNPAALTTTMTILWWTDVVGNSVVEYGLTPSLGQSVTVGQAASCEVGSAGTCHTVPLTGLQPGTRYYYRLLTNGTQVLATTYFQTFKAPTDTSELYFTIVGDWGQGSSAQGQIGNNINADDPPLVMTVGDNAYTNGTQSDWDNNVFITQWKNGILRRGVFMPVLGNHDLNNVGASNWQSSVEIKMHALPRNANAGQEERYYSFDYGNAHFVVLDSNPPGINATQTAWLQADLAATTRKWKFVFFHHTPYSCANGIASIGSDHTVRDTWGPIFEQAGVDIVFDGHDHSYERTHLMNDYNTGGPGTIYIMTGGGGASLDGAAQVDSGGPYGSGFTHSKEYCPWLATNCSNGVNGQYCSFSKFQHTEVRIVNDSVLTLKSIDNNDAVFDTLVLNKGTIVCGNGSVEGTEQCDQGAANGTVASCCNSSCQYVSIGTTCRVSAGECDVAETCSGASGACPANAFRPSSRECRSSVGGCDPAEFCTGSSAACPNDTIFGNGTVCRASVGVCDLAELCNGSDTACPPDAKSTAPCRNAVDLCDAVESCNGISNTCPADEMAPNGTPCRVAVDGCDVTETCTGSSTACPADGFAPSTVVCRPATTVCDVAETCTGVSPDCPADQFAANTVTCRAATTACDVAEKCTGASANCPADAFAPSTTVCRPSINVCDAAENCTGSSTTCPPDAFATASTVCRPAVSLCDVAENCTGSSNACPADVVAPSTTVCRPANGVCDVAEQCNGTTTICPANAFAPNTQLCRPANGVCDVDDFCSGTSANCPADGFANTTVLCRAAAGVCDAVEKCSGSSPNCPADGFLSPAVECRPSAGACDVPEQCSGSSIDCPADTGQPDGDGDGICDLEDDCPEQSDASQADTDNDGLGDACDPCTNGTAVHAVKSKITLQNLALPLGDDRFRFQGEMTVPSGSIDPSTAGLRVMITDAGGQTIVDATIPPGLYSDATLSGWKVNGPHTAFVYKNKGGTITSLQGVNKVVVKRSLKVPGQVKFNVSAVGGAYPLPGSLPVKGTVILDPPYATTNQCGDAIFPGPTKPVCAYTAPAGTIKCK
jgi:hypothetical protein